MTTILIIAAVVALLGLATLGMRFALRWRAARPPRPARSAAGRFRMVPIAATLAALLGLLAYSLERTIWLFQRFEVAAEPAIAAAVVVELAAVALIVSAGALPPSARPWGNRALLAVLSVQALANLSAGYLRGGRATLALFGGADDPSAYAVASVLWLVTNLAIPGLTLSLSKLLEHLIKSALEALPERLDAPDAPRVVSDSAPAPQALFQALPLPALPAEPAERFTLLAELFEPQAPQAVASGVALEAPSVSLAPPSDLSDPPSASTPVLEVPVFESLDDFRANLLSRMAAAEHPGVPLSEITVVETPRYACPHCGAALKSKQARGAAVSNGSCPSCKGAR